MTIGHARRFMQVEGAGIDTVEPHAFGLALGTCAIPVITWACDYGGAVDEPVADATQP